MVFGERLYKLLGRNRYRLSVESKLKLEIQKLKLKRQQDEAKISELTGRLESLRVKHELGHRYGPVFPPAPIQKARPGAICIFRADCMEYTPFSAGRPIPEVLAAGGVELVDNPASANIIIARREEALQVYGSCNVNFAIWTNEPRYNNRVETPATVHGIRNPVHIMNAYTGQIYVDNFYYFQRREIDYDEMMRAFARKPRRAVILASYRAPPTDVVLDGRDIDLQQSRQQLALRLLEYAFCDVYGRNWPKNTKILGESRRGAWRDAKFDILSRYKLNICFENTIIPHYVTEKLWDAILGACLPIYHGSNDIYETFSKNSFIEAGGKSIEKLASEVINMSPEEMDARYSACLRAYLDACKQDRGQLSYDDRLARTLCFLRSI